MQETVRSKSQIDMFLAKTEQIAVVPLRTQLFVHMVTIAKTAMSEAKLWSFMAE